MYSKIPHSTRYNRHVTVKDNWRRLVAEIAAAGTPRGRARLGCCSLEGIRLFERALRAGVSIENCVVTDALLNQPSLRERGLLELLEAAGCQPVVVPSPVMAELTGGRGTGDIVGLAAMPPQPSLEKLLMATDAAPVFLGGIHIDDPGNVGALVRTAHASGSSGLLTVGATDAFHPRAVRTSMGSVFRQPILRWDTMNEMLSDLREHGVRTLAAVSDGGTPLPAVARVSGPCAVFLGSEAFGLETSFQESVDERVTIPMAHGVDSLSVNAAAAVLLYALKNGR